LKFVTHFTGDITQPLHTSGVAIGGNAYNVSYGNRTTNLHSVRPLLLFPRSLTDMLQVWDGAILYSAAGVTGFSNTTLSPFFSSLGSRITADTFFEPTAKWLSCVDPSTPTECAMEWARDANSWTCDYLYSQIFNGTNLLTSGYAQGAYPIVELQVSKAALRLASWLNALVAGKYNMDREIILRTNPSWLLGTAAGA
jgi:S1/P1 Nuclease